MFVHWNHHVLVTATWHHAPDYFRIRSQCTQGDISLVVEKETSGGLGQRHKNATGWFM